MQVKMKYLNAANLNDIWKASFKIVPLVCILERKSLTSTNNKYYMQGYVWPAFSWSIIFSMFFSIDCGSATSDQRSFLFGNVIFRQKRSRMEVALIAISSILGHVAMRMCDKWHLLHATFGLAGFFTWVKATIT